MRVAESLSSTSERELERSHSHTGHECEGECGAGHEQEGALFLLMGKESGSDVDGEELRGKPKRRLPLLHVSFGLQILQQNGKGEVF